MIKQILIAIDQLFNALLCGYADETLSARAYRERYTGLKYAYHFINFLFFWQANHCRAAYENEMNRKQLPTEYR